ncbi:polysaccharide biosynthesis/export family protein [Confluentibacter sediminis]|uniref:polysaccharide biosynthesis/export family protein n=1 Tax=Confluentibacter sediminis TaxID=2219045 RepID=UPI000DAC041D|nr:polysaccharide biosynthesis/export family protein [Confluentibacter sediminis]
MNRKAIKIKSLIYLLLLSSCVTQKDLLYFQDASNYNDTPINYTSNTIQANDILSVNISALVPESAAAYNTSFGGNTTQTPSIDILRLQGYLVSLEGTINLPVLGTIKVAGESPVSLEAKLVNTLETGGHLIAPIVKIRVLNAKVTVLGEVNSPGTYNFTEQFITLPQALGYAGDLKINGKRNDILLIREVDGIRHITHIDITSTYWMNDPRYIIKPNDVIVVNPNQAKVKSAGIIGNAGTVLSIVSVILSTTILLTR